MIVLTSTTCLATHITKATYKKLEVFRGELPTKVQEVRGRNGIIQRFLQKKAVHFTGQFNISWVFFLSSKLVLSRLNKRKNYPEFS